MYFGRVGIAHHCEWNVNNFSRKERKGRECCFNIKKLFAPFALFAAKCCRVGFAHRRDEIWNRKRWAQPTLRTSDVLW